MHGFGSVKVADHASRLAAVMWLAIVHYTVAAPADVLVRNADEFRQAIGQAKAGTRILLSAGTYPGGFYFTDLHGETITPSSSPPRILPIRRLFKVAAPGCTFLNWLSSSSTTWWSAT